MAIIWLPAYSPEFFREKAKRDAEEANRRFFNRVQVEMPKAIEESGLFNMINCNACYGFEGYISLKKYPNIMAKISFVPDRPQNTIEFKCYINEHKWTTFSISEIQFLDLIKFDLFEQKTPQFKFLQKLFLFFQERFPSLQKKNEPKQRFFTEYHLFYFVENLIKLHEYNLKPGLFRYESEKYILDWDKKEVSKYLNYCNPVVMYVPEFNVDKGKYDMVIKEFYLDSVQRMMYLMANKNGEV